jgi:hypothetical protein
VWWAGRASLDIYVGACRLAAVAPEGSWLPPPVADATQGLNLLSDWLVQRSKRHPVRVWLGGALCRPFLMPDMPGLPPTQAQRALRAVASERTGLNPDCRVWCEPSGVGRGPRIGAAVEGLLLDGLMATLAKSRAHCLSLRPWW